MKKTYYIDGYITNLGKYNEGILNGKYIRFPISKKELKKVLSEIGINNEYEEWFFTDYDGEYPSCVNEMLGEYTSIRTLNKIALALEKVCDEGVQEQFIAFMEIGHDFFGACANALNGNAIYIEGSDYSDLAYFWVDDVFGGIEEISEETLNEYLDYEMLGRDVRLEFYNEDNPDETAGEFWCGDENATDEEIGQAIVDECGLEGVSNKSFYFDYSEYGRAIFNESDYVFTENGIVDCSDYNDSLGEDFEKDIERELNENEIEHNEEER